MTDASGTEVAIIPAAEAVELGVITASNPAQLVARATEAANALAAVINDRKLYSTIQGRRFVRCEGWTTLAAMLGVTPHEISVTEQDGAFTATVELRRITDGQPVGRASAECGGTGESLWDGRSRNARRSMALTRATGKACRLCFSWVMALAGFEVTPAEEMPEHEGKAVRGTTVGSAKDAATVSPTARPLDQVPPPLAEPEPDPLDPKEMVMPIGKHKGAKLGVLSSAILVNAEEWMRGSKKYDHYARAIGTILKDRGGE